MFDRLSCCGPTCPGCHAAFALWQLGKAPADLCDPEHSHERVWKMDGRMMAPKIRLFSAFQIRRCTCTQSKQLKRNKSRGHVFEAPQQTFLSRLLCERLRDTTRIFHPSASASAVPQEPLIQPQHVSEPITGGFTPIKKICLLKMAVLFPLSPDERKVLSP